MMAEHQDKGSSLRANVVANAASQLWVALAGILMMPFYLRHMGAEAYGLIGIFTLMNAWFQTLDIGLSLTLTRESARFRAGVIDAPTLRALVKTLEAIFFGVAAIGAVIVTVAAHSIAADWLNVKYLPIEKVTTVVMLMGLTVPLQWASGLYRGALNGFERQVWLAGFNAAMATLRFGGAATVIMVVGADPLNFFQYQLGVSGVELLALIWMSWQILPPIDPARRRLLRRSEAEELLKFSTSLAFAIVVWVMVTQIDKLILSRILPLAEYGIFSLAVLAASGVLLLGGPMGLALLPRLSKMVAQHATDEVLKLYRNATQLVCVMAIPAALVLALFPESVIWVWTGDARIAPLAGPILAPYALGNCFMTIAAFAYYLQYANGDLRLHVIGNMLLMILMVPALALAATRFGARGSGYAWLGVNAAYFALWVPLVHRRIAPHLHLRWLTHDIFPIAATSTLTAWALSMAAVPPPGRISAAAFLCETAIALLLAAACGSSEARRWVWAHRWRFGLRTGARP